jgi:hypothetical protein
VLQSVALKAAGFRSGGAVPDFLFLRCKPAVQHLFVALALDGATARAGWALASVSSAGRGNVRRMARPGSKPTGRFFVTGSKIRCFIVNDSKTNGKNHECERTA